MPTRVPNFNFLAPGLGDMQGSQNKNWELLTSPDAPSGEICTRSHISRNYGMTAESIADVFSSTVMAKLMYRAPAWSGFTSAADRARLNAFLRRCQRLGYCSGETPTTVSELFSDTD